MKLINIYIKCCQTLLGVKKDKVMFISYGGKSYSDNPRSISEKLHEISSDIKIVWGFLNPKTKEGLVPSYVKKIDVSKKFTYYKEIATSGVFVSNCTMQYVKKSKKQMFVQTWHGDRAFKKVLYDSEFVENNFSLAEQNEGFCDIAIAGSDYGESQYRTAFRYKGKVLKEGTPRNDRLVHPSKKNIDDIKNKLGIKKDVKILLYAPTLRRESVGKGQLVQDVNFAKTVELLETKYNCEWVCFVRAHSAVGGLLGVELNDKIREVSFCEDMADLLLISDMLITDYSSCAGDFALLKKPIILYQSDRKEYEEYDRGFYFKMEDSPYYIAENQEELENIILEMDDEKAEKNCEDILEFYRTNESGKSSELVANLIVEHSKKF